MKLFFFTSRKALRLEPARYHSRFL